MNRILLLVLVLSIYSCSGGCNKSSESSRTVITSATMEHDNFIPSAPTEYIGQGVDIDAVIKRKGRLLENACTIVSEKVIADALGLIPQQLKSTNSSPRDANPTHSSCFFKWEDYDRPNAGILLQMMRNPNENEFQDYVLKFIESFRLRGEQGMEEAPIIYRKFEGFGDDGSYSTDGAKYFWRLGDKVIFSIAFNTSHSPAEQYRIATTLAKVMTQNYLK